MHTMQKPIDNQAVYHTWVLVVLWVFQLIVEIIIIGVNAFYVAVLSAIAADNTYQVNVSGTLAAVAISLAFGICFLISHIVQIVFYGRRRLTPRANFAYDCTRFVFWTIAFIVGIVGAALNGGYILSLIFAALVWVLYLMGVIYASILFHRQRSGQYDNLLPVSAEQSRLQNQRNAQGKHEGNYQDNNQNGAYQLSNQQPQQSHQLQQPLQQPYQQA